jgi:hypothetical protein
MKFKVKLATLSVMLCANAIADPVYLPPAQNLTYGNSSNNQSIMSSITNPAAAAAQLGNEDNQYRFGILSSIGAGYEFGNVGQLYNTIDNAKNTITTPITTSQLTTMYATDCPSGTCTPAQSTAFATDIATTINGSAAVATVNTVLSQLQQDGTVSVYGDVHVPLTPFVVTKKGLGGSIVLDANYSAIANMSFLADPLFISNATATNIANTYSTYADPAGNNSNGTYTLPAIPNDSTLLIKAAVVEEIGLGYSRPVLKRENGDLTAGVRAKYYKVKLVRDAELLDQQTNGSKSTFNASKSYTSSTGFGLDVGTLWTAKRYRLGAWVNNLNSPSFDYNTIDPTKLAAYTNPAIISQLSASDTYKMKPQLEMEGAFYSESQNWVLNAGLDGNAVQDPVGRDFQWATLSAAYATNSWWIPGIRLGYRTNLAGSKLSYTTAGLTLIKALSLDIAYGMDSITDNNGKKIPRSFMATLGIQMTF